MSAKLHNPISLNQIKIWSIDYIFILLNVFMHSCIHAFMYSCIHVFMHSCIHVFMYSCIIPYIYIIKFDPDQCKIAEADTANSPFPVDGILLPS
jgi:hypothetical protein